LLFVFMWYITLMSSISIDKNNGSLGVQDETFFLCCIN